MKRQPDFRTASRRAHEVLPSTGRGVVLGAAALVLALVAAWWVDADLGEARRALSVARAAAASAEQRSRAQAGRGDTGAALVAAQSRMSSQAPPPRVLVALQALQPAGVRLDRIALSYGESVDLEVEVYARQAADYDRFLAALEASPVFSAVTPGAENREGEVRSSLALRYAWRGTP